MRICGASIQPPVAITRMGNEEEGCKRRFWKGRFKSQALLDEAVLQSCITYVYLNPISDSMGKDLIDSDFASIQQRSCIAFLRILSPDP